MATFTLMSQFEDPSAQTSVDPYSDAYTQPVASSRDQEPNPHRSHSPSREQPASYNRPSTPPKRPAHAPIVSYRDAATLDCLSTYLSGSEPMSSAGYIWPEHPYDRTRSRRRVQSVRPCRESSHSLRSTRKSRRRPVRASFVNIASVQSARSRGFGFITMSSVEEAARCIEKLNGIVCHSPYPP